VRTFKLGHVRHFALIRHCRPLTQTATCLYHDTMERQTYRRKRSIGQSYNNSLATLLKKRSACKNLPGCKHTRSKANRKTHSAQVVTVKSRDAHKRSVNMGTVCAQQDGSISSLLQCVYSRAYVLVHVVGPLATTTLCQATCLYVTVEFAILRSQSGVGFDNFHDLRSRSGCRVKVFGADMELKNWDSVHL